MERRDRIATQLIWLGSVTLLVAGVAHGVTPSEKHELRLKSKEMFLHGYKSYMNNAYPADELMPLSCKGRFRGLESSRGDIDDALGNFSLTLIDTLDTLLVVGEVEEFERAVRLVTRAVTFDTDVVVSVFETNIRVLGGLLGGHMMAEHAKQKLGVMSWYNGELLTMARDLGDRLLPAFNTSTGIPFPRVNLRYGVKHDMSRTGSERDTCTACAGSMILEFSALSRLTGNKVYEEKASKAMDYLWKSRHRASDLVGTVINIHNGDWVRRDSGIGAGIDSYYEYLLKAYIMLGDETFLNRFNRHYRAIMKYISNGPLMVDVHMHKPYTQSRNFMDALLAFWPGVQVLKGDLKSAIELHEMLYQVMQRHNFLPEAFTTEFRVHWANHPLRPEFVESTYFIYKATGDPYYLDVGKSVMENLEQHARVPCGFAAIKDVTTGRHEDQMDSYVLAETFKYLYLLFTDKEDLLVDVDEYVFSTEAHLLPLFLSVPGSYTSNVTEPTPQYILDELAADDLEDEKERTCPSTNHLFKGTVDYAHSLRSPLKNFVENLCPRPKSGNRPARLKASQFIAGNLDHIAQLSRMGVRLITMSDGRIQLLHLASEAASPEDSNDGLQFMQDMVEMSKLQSADVVQQEPRFVQFVSHPYNGLTSIKAGPAQFGTDLKGHPGVQGEVVVAEPLRGCQPLENVGDISGKFIIVERGDCMFIDKARHIQEAGGIGGIVFDNNSQSSSDNQPLFAMSGDGKADVSIPMVFLFYSEAQKLKHALRYHPGLVVYVGETVRSPDDKLIKSLQTVSPTQAGGASDPGPVPGSVGTGDQDDAQKVLAQKHHQMTQLLETLLAQIHLNPLIPMLRGRRFSRLTQAQADEASAVDEKADDTMGRRTAEELSRQVHVLGAEVQRATQPSLSGFSSGGAGKSRGGGGASNAGAGSTGGLNDKPIATVRDCENDVLGCDNSAHQTAARNVPDETSKEEREKQERRRQSLVRDVYIEFVLLLNECTTLARLDTLAQTTSALARLTERVFTGGRMSYGLQTEQILESLASILDILPTCHSAASSEKFIKDNSDVLANGPDSDSMDSKIPGADESLNNGADSGSTNGRSNNNNNNNNKGQNEDSISSSNNKIPITNQFDLLLDAYIQIQLQQLLKVKSEKSSDSSTSTSPSSGVPSNNGAGGRSSRDFNRNAMSSGGIKDMSNEERFKAASVRATALMEAAVRRHLKVPEEVLMAPTWMNLQVGGVSMHADGKIYMNLGNEGGAGEIQLSEDITEIIGTPQRSEASSIDVEKEKENHPSSPIEGGYRLDSDSRDQPVGDQSNSYQSTQSVDHPNEETPLDEIYTKISSNIEAAAEILRALDAVESELAGKTESVGETRGFSSSGQNIDHSSGIPSSSDVTGKTTGNPISSEATSETNGIPSQLRQGGSSEEIASKESFAPVVIRINMQGQTETLQEVGQIDSKELGHESEDRSRTSDETSGLTGQSFSGSKLEEVPATRRNNDEL